MVELKAAVAGTDLGSTTAASRLRELQAPESTAIVISLRKVTIEGVLKDFLSVLDDVRSAREHDELSGGFKAVAEEIERVTSSTVWRRSASRVILRKRISTKHCCTRTLRHRRTDLRGVTAAGVPNRRSHSAARPGPDGEPGPSQCPESVEGPSTNSRPMLGRRALVKPDRRIGGGDSRAGDR